MEPNTRFKAPISLVSLATISIAAILFTVFVMNHEGIEAGAATLFLFALIFFGPVSLFFMVVLESGWPIAIKVIILLGVTPLILAAAFLRSKYSDIFRPISWFLWVLCSLTVAGLFI